MIEMRTVAGLLETDRWDLWTRASESEKKKKNVETTLFGDAVIKSEIHKPYPVCC